MNKPVLEQLLESFLSQDVPSRSGAMEQILKPAPKESIDVQIPPATTISQEPPNEEMKTEEHLERA